MALKNRFEDKKLLKQNHIRILWNILVLNKESFYGLRWLLDDTNNNLLALEVLGDFVNSWDAIIIYLMTTKLDTVPRKEMGKNSIFYNWRHQIIKFNTISGNPV